MPILQKKGGATWGGKNDPSCQCGHEAKQMKKRKPNALLPLGVRAITTAHHIGVAVIASSRFSSNLRRVGAPHVHPQNS